MKEIRKAVLRPAILIVGSDAGYETSVASFKRLWPKLQEMRAAGSSGYIGRTGYRARNWSSGGECYVHYSAGVLDVGCQRIDYGQVRAVAEKLGLKEGVEA